MQSCEDFSMDQGIAWKCVKRVLSPAKSTSEAWEAFLQNRANLYKHVRILYVRVYVHT